MKRNIVLLILPVFFSLQACKNKKESWHLSHAQMSSLLLDMHAAEAYSTMALKDSTRKGDTKNFDSLAQYYTDIFAHYHITKEQFDQNLDWYKQHQDDLDSVYSAMLPEFSKLESIYKAKK